MAGKSHLNIQNRVIVPAVKNLTMPDDFFQLTPEGWTMLALVTTLIFAMIFMGAFR